MLERAQAIAASLLERYGVVLREAPSAEGLTGGFANVYDVYRVMEDQGRVRRGYFVGGRGATQFALPGAEERLRARARNITDDADDERSRIRVLASTDPANPYGALLPWPGPPGRSGQRAPGTRVLLHDGELLAWLGRGRKNMITFFADADLDVKGETLARALVAMFERRGKSAILVTIDGVPAPESPLAKVLSTHGFVARQGQLVRMLRS